MAVASSSQVVTAADTKLSSRRDNEEEEDEQQDDTISLPDIYVPEHRIYRQTTMRFYQDPSLRYPCSNGGGCGYCDSTPLTTFQLGYYMHFGLDFPRVDDMLASNFDRETRRVVTALTVAKSFEIMESRVQKLRQVLPLKSLAMYYVVANLTPVLDQMNIPPQLRDEIDLFDGGFDMADRCNLQLPGKSVFQVFHVPNFLLRHLNKYLFVDM